MKCLDIDQLYLYLDGETPAEQTHDIESHLLQCTNCRQWAKELEKEQQDLSQLLQNPPLPDDFTQQVMAEIEKEKANIPVSLTKKKKSRLKKISIITGTVAASLALALGIGTTVSPTFAEMIEKIFFLNSKQVDSSIQTASKNGFAQAIYAQVTDQGYTLEVTEIMADTTRIVVALRIRDQQGNYHTPTMNIGPVDRKNSNTATIIDKSGKEVAQLYRNNWSRDADFSYMEFEPKQALPNQVNLQLNLTFLSIPYKTDMKQIKGNWKLTVPIDLKKVKSGTKTIKINKEMPVLNGYTIKLDEIGFAPSATTVRYRVKISEAEQQRILELLEKNQYNFEDLDHIKKEPHLLANLVELKYKIIDQKGKTIIDSRRDLRGAGIPPEFRNAKLKENVRQDQFETPLLPKQPLRFVLEGIMVREFVNYRIPVAIDTLPSQPVTTTLNGETFTIQNFDINLDPYSNKKNAYQIEMHTKQSEPFSHPFRYHWIASDETGKIYEVHLSSGSTKKDAHGKEFRQNFLTIYGLDHRPKQLTLQLVSMEVTKKVKWETEIKR